MSTVNVASQEALNAIRERRIIDYLHRMFPWKPLADIEQIYAAVGGRKSEAIQLLQQSEPGKHLSEE